MHFFRHVKRASQASGTALPGQAAASPSSEAPLTPGYPKLLKLLSRIRAMSALEPTSFSTAFEKVFSPLTDDHLAALFCSLVKKTLERDTSLSLASGTALRQAAASQASGTALRQAAAPQASGTALPGQAAASQASGTALPGQAAASQASGTALRQAAASPSSEAPPTPRYPNLLSRIRAMNQSGARLFETETEFKRVFSRVRPPHLAALFCSLVEKTLERDTSLSLLKIIVVDGTSSTADCWDGRFDPRQHRIMLQSDLRISTLIHELAHATIGHQGVYTHFLESPSVRQPLSTLHAALLATEDQDDSLEDQDDSLVDQMRSATLEDFITLSSRSEIVTSLRNGIKQYDLKNQPEELAVRLIELSLTFPDNDGFIKALESTFPQAIPCVNAMKEAIHLLLSPTPSPTTSGPRLC